MLEENWKRRLDDIVRKNRQKERESYHRAEKMRKDAEVFWSKKKSQNIRDVSEKIDKKSETIKPFASLARHDLKREHPIETHYIPKSYKVEVNFPDVTGTKSKFNKVDFGNKNLNRSIG